MAMPVLDRQLMRPGREAAPRSHCPFFSLLALRRAHCFPASKARWCFCRVIWCGGARSFRKPGERAAPSDRAKCKIRTLSLRTP